MRYLSKVCTYPVRHRTWCGGRSRHVTTGSERRALTLTVMSFTILRASARARVLLTPPQRVARGTQTVCSSTHALIRTHSRSIYQRTLTNILDPHRNPTLWNRDGPAQGAVRTLTTAATAVPSDQLGFVPDQHPTTDLPIANADDRKIAILWTPQNRSRLYVFLCFFLPWRYHTLTSSHHIWLRDHCRCPSCFHPVTKQRLLNTFEVCCRGSNGVILTRICVICGLDPFEYQTASYSGFGRGPRSRLYVFGDITLTRYG